MTRLTSLESLDNSQPIKSRILSSSIHFTGCLAGEFANQPAILRISGRHAVARAICYGQRGEIRKRYRAGQEDQLGALGLVTNAAVLWNTIYRGASLDHLREQLIEVREEDEARLSPLVNAHINVLGHYSFTLSENVMKGRLRPLNDPT